jgi:cytochrome c-type biogenesis protein CcmH/NrfG
MQLIQEHLRAKRPAEAAKICRHILAAQPDYPDALYLLANALREQDDLPGAIAACRRVTEILPQSPMGYSNLAVVLMENAQIDESIAASRQALSLDPNLADVQINLAEGLRRAGRISEAIDICRAAIRLKPDYALAHTKLGDLLLLTGDFGAGMPEYFWRYRMVFPEEAHYELFLAKLWDGGDLSGRRILIGAEGGFGDVIQFCRYAPLVAERGGKVSLAAPPELHRLMKTLVGVDEVTVTGQPPASWDVHCLCMHLPKLFDSTPENLPNRTPYLFADASRANGWTQRLAPYNGRLKVGIAWAGSKTNRYRRARELPVESLSPLAAVAGISFFSLQKGVADQAKMASQFSSPLQWTDWTDELRDFADTASLISRMDLVIAPDSAVAHLAGALGKPVWVMLPLLHDWRWLLGRSDSPWYPTMRLYRQAQIGDWRPVITAIATDLRALPH